MSEREEEFLDLPVALSGHSGLEDALRESYIKLESLEKQNQYYCNSCKELVDAKRVGLHTCVCAHTYVLHVQYCRVVILENFQQY